MPVGGEQARGVLVGIDRDVKERNVIAAPTALAGGDQLAPPARNAYRDDIDLLTDDDTAAREGRVVERIVKRGELSSSSWQSTVISSIRASSSASSLRRVFIAVVSCAVRTERGGTPPRR